jgi:hypothetical protein
MSIEFIQPLVLQVNRRKGRARHSVLAVGWNMTGELACSND